MALQWPSLEEAKRQPNGHHDYNYDAQNASRSQYQGEYQQPQTTAAWTPRDPSSHAHPSASPGHYMSSTINSQVR